MRFLDPNHLKTARLGQAFPMTFSSAGQGNPGWYRLFIHHDGPASGGNADLLIDTGADCDGVLDPGLFQRQVQKQRSRDPENTAQDQEPNSVVLPQCIWNGVTYTDLWFTKGVKPQEGETEENSLGLRFLARHLVTFDFPHRIMYLKRTRSGPLVDPELVATAKAARDSAFKFARQLRLNGHLPGWSKNDRGTWTYIYHFHRDPDTVTLDLPKKGDSSTYHYEFTRVSPDSLWKLQKAWRTDQDDHMVEEYPVP